MSSPRSAAQQWAGQIGDRTQQERLLQMAIFRRRERSQHPRLHQEALKVHAGQEDA